MSDFVVEPHLLQIHLLIVALDDVARFIEVAIGNRSECLAHLLDDQPPSPACG